jgi:hypothetical protein
MSANIPKEGFGPRGVGIDPATGKKPVPLDQETVETISRIEAGKAADWLKNQEPVVIGQAVANLKAAEAQVFATVPAFKAAVAEWTIAALALLAAQKLRYDALRAAGKDHIVPGVLFPLGGKAFHAGMRSKDALAVWASLITQIEEK